MSPMETEDERPTGEERGPSERLGDAAADLTHGHRFHFRNPAGERRTRAVVALTLVMMAVEVTAGVAFGSMALLADGWHMGTHAAALGITLIAYWYARRHEDDPSFTFGTGKVGALGGFASSVGLALVSLAMAAESIRRLVAPERIRFDEAILVAVVGLVVNLASALMLRDRRPHGRGGARDLNLRAAYMHVLADALTSVTAIVALVIGRFAGWVWLDPAMGLVGAAVILKWSAGLLRDTSEVLLDRSVDAGTVSRIREIVEAEGGIEVADLHVWRLGPGRLAAEISLVSKRGCAPADVKARLAQVPDLVHVTVEVNEV